MNQLKKIKKIEKLLKKYNIKLEPIIYIPTYMIKSGIDDYYFDEIAIIIVSNTSQFNKDAYYTQLDERYLQFLLLLFSSVEKTGEWDYMNFMAWVNDIRLRNNRSPQNLFEYFKVKNSKIEKLVKILENASRGYVSIKSLNERIYHRLIEYKARNYSIKFDKFLL